MKYIDLFSGVGGFHQGLIQAGFKFDWVGISEIDKYAKSIYKKHFPKSEDLGDVRKIDPKRIISQYGKIDIITGGFPCPDFSIAGKRKGFDGKQGDLFFEICRLCKEIQPKILFLENVRGLLSHEYGSTFEVILRELGNLGYDVEWQVLNSKHYGVPQNRERVFILGYLGGFSGRQIFPIRQDSKADYVVPTLTTRYCEAQANGAYLREISPKGNKQGYRVYDPKGIASMLASEAGGLGAKTGLYAVAWSKSHRTGKSEQDKKRKNYGEVEERIKLNEFNTLSTGIGGGSQSSMNYVGEGYRLRRLTALECERVQGFADNWTEGLSDNQRYKCMGNAVTVNVIEVIGKKLLEIFKNNS